jgi:hypothetical protein
MDCFVACAPLRKRFALVAGNDGWEQCGLNRFAVKWIPGSRYARPGMTGGEQSVLIRYSHPGSGAIAPSARTVTRSRPFVLARNRFMVA